MGRHRKRRLEVALAVDVAVHDHQHVATLGEHTRHGKRQRRGRRLHSPTMADTANLTDTTAIVTGGASGMGEATARRLAAAGATVVILDRDPIKGEKVATDLGGRFVQADVTSEDDVSAAVAAAAASRRSARAFTARASAGRNAPSIATAARTTSSRSGRSSTSI